MANTLGPQGFQRYLGTGVTPSFELVERAVSSSNTGAIFQGDPVMPAASATGVATGYVTQGYAPVVLTVAATGIASSASGVVTITLTAQTTGVPGSPNAWAPPVGSAVVVSGSTVTSGAGLNGSYTVASATTTTAVMGASTSTPESATSTASGTVTCYVPVAGIFQTCKYLSVSQKRPVWNNYYPGSDANTAAAVTAYLDTDPLGQYLVQTANTNTTATAVGLANIGANASFGYLNSGGSQTNGNTASGLSTFFLDQYTIGTSEFLPFKIISLPGYEPDGNNPFSTTNNNDYTSAYNNVVVGWNNSTFKQLRGV